MADESVPHLFHSIEAFCRNFYYITANPENVYLSPLCLHATLSMLYEGTTDLTRRQIKNVLNLHEPDINTNAYRQLLYTLSTIQDFQLFLLCSIYVQDRYPIRRPFQRIVTEIFRSEVDKLNYLNNINAAHRINRRVEQRSNDKISGIADPGDFNFLTHIVLVNAGYFEGEWVFKFENTTMEPFYLSETDTVLCNMMSLTARIEYAYNKELNSEILRLPFINSLFSVIILFPRSMFGMEHLERQLRQVSFAELIETLDSSIQRSIRVPKFMIEKKYDLNNELQRAGFGRIFRSSRDFGFLVNSTEEVCISKVLQKNSIAFNEDGISATPTEALTGSEEEGTPIDLTINHQFMFALVMEYEGQYFSLFIGKLFNPS